MATKKAGSVDIISIDLETNIKDLDELKKTIVELKKAQKLSNTNNNTYKSVLGELDSTSTKMRESQKSGKLDISTAKEIGLALEKIKGIIGKIISQEGNTGLTLEQYNAAVTAATKAVEHFSSTIKRQQNALEHTHVKNGKIKKEERSAVMHDAAIANKRSRGKTKFDPFNGVEEILLKGDYDEMVKKAKAGSEDHKKALDYYNARAEQYIKSWEEIKAIIAEATSNLNLEEQKLSEAQSKAAYDPDAVRQLEKAQKTLTSTKKDVDKLSTSLIENNQKFAKVGKTVAKTDTQLKRAAKAFISFAVVGQTLKRMLREGLKAVNEMDKALTDMSIVTGEARENLQKMIPEFNSMGRAVGATSTEMAGLTAEYMKQGRTMSDAKELAIQTAKAAKISGISTAESVEYMTAAINGFNLAAKDAEHVSDVFAKLGAQSATDYEDLAIALSKVSAQANTAGMSIEFTSALLAKGLETTQEAPESIGTALKTILARMRELSDYGSTLEDGVNVNKVESALQAVGVQLRDTNGQFRDMETIFNELGPKWDDLNTMQQQAVAQAVAGTRQQSRFLAIMQDWNRTIQLSNASLTAEGSTMYQHSQYAQSLEFSINKLTTAWQGFVGGLVNNDLVRDFLSFVAESMSKLTDAINWLNDHTHGLAGTLTTIGVPLALILGMVKERLTKLREEKILREEALKQEYAKYGLNTLQTTLEREKTQELKKQTILTDEILKKQSNYISLWGKLKKLIKSPFDYMLKGSNKLLEITKKINAVNADKKIMKMKDKLFGKENLSAKQRLKYGKQLIAVQDAKYEKLKQVQASLMAERKTLSKTDAGDVERAQELTEQIKRNGQELSKITKSKTKIAEQAGIEVGLSKENLRTKQQETTETKKSTAETVKEGTAQTAVTVQNKEQLRTERKKNREKKKGILYTIKDTIHNVTLAVVNIAQAVASQIGIPAAIAAGALLAGVGFTAGSFAINKSTKDTSKSSEKSNNKIYENTETKSELENLRSEYLELDKKKIKSKEDNERLSEIEQEFLNKGVSKNDEESWNQAIDRKIEELNNDSAEISAKNMEDIAKQQELTWTDELKALIKDIGAGIKKIIDLFKPISDWLKNSTMGKVVSKGFEAVSYILNPIKTISTIGNAIANAVSPGRKERIQQEKAKEVLTDKNNQLAIKNNAMIDLEKSGINKKNLAQSKRNLEAAYNSLNWEAIATEHSKDYSTFLEKNIKDPLINAEKELSETSEENLQEQINKYNELIEGLDSDIAKNAFKSAHDDLNLLSKSGNAIQKALNAGKSQENIMEVVHAANNAGIEDINPLIEGLSGNKEDYRKTLDSMYNGSFFSGEMADLSDEDRNKIIEQFTKAYSGFDGNVNDFRTKTNSQLNNVEKLRTAIGEGNLTQADQEELANNYGKLYAREDFQKALKSKGVKAQMMLDEEVNNQNQNKIDTLNLHKEDLNAQIEALKNKYNDSQTSEEDRKTLEAQIQQLQVQKNLTDEAIADIEKYKDRYEKFNETLNDSKNIQAEIDSIRKQMDSRQYHSAKEYETLTTKLGELKKKESEMYKDSVNNLEKELDLQEGQLKNYIERDTITGKLKLKTEAVAGMDGVRRKYLEEHIGALEEQSVILADIEDQEKEIAKQQRESAIELQEKAIDAMKKRLEEEYNATKESLDKRKELYSKYFDAISQEQEEEEYSDKRGTLVNTIASLSTATDSESLAKLKEAQQELADLDKEKSRSDLEMSRQAVEESMQSEEEKLDKAYEDRLKDVQSMWEEVSNMSLEEMESFFTTYGEGFQEVTDLQKEVAEETLNDYLIAMGKKPVQLKTKEGDNPQYAEGGLVDYTGPAWVDGTPSKPEAFLDAQDTANIASLAQGLRVLMNNSHGLTTGSESNSGMTINELNINVNSNGGGDVIGNDVANSFLNALKENGININRKK